MPAHRNPAWTREEVTILREEYPRGGLNAVADLLADRSWHSIYVKANKLGIKCERNPDAPKCVLSGGKLEQAIRLREHDGWSFARIGAEFGVAESSACNAVMIALCTRKGHTPAERHSNGRLTHRGLERLRWCLKKGLKGVEIQLRLGLSASCIAEQRRRYNRDLKMNGKALLPPAGAGLAYSGLKLSRERKADVERLFLEGYGTAKVSTMSGVSKTSCTRIRNRLVQKLRRRGEALPGCDGDGKRCAMRDHARHVPNELKAKFRELVLERVPVRRAAGICGIGTCTAYRLRDDLKAQLGELPKPRLPGKTKPLQREMMRAQAIPAEHMWRFRELVREHGSADKARAVLRAELAQAKRNRSFEDQLKLVEQGAVAVVRVQKLVANGPDRTLGGIATGALV